jgi:hypothetical protein
MRSRWAGDTIDLDLDAKISYLEFKTDNENAKEVPTTSKLFDFV